MSVLGRNNVAVDSWQSSPLVDLDQDGGHQRETERNSWIDEPGDDLDDDTRPRTFEPFETMSDSDERARTETPPLQASREVTLPLSEGSRSPSCELGYANDRVVVASPALSTSLETPANQTGLFYDPRLLRHTNLFPDEDEEYCEVPERVEKAYEELKRRGLASRCIRLSGIAATYEQLRLVHTEEHIQEISSTRDMEMDQLKLMSKERYNDVYFSDATADAASLSCGGAIAVAEAVWLGHVENAIALIRPPGHHAEATKALGFCIYSNVAVAARVLQQQHGVQRILIVDWDVHHGNGTQRAFWNDPNVLFISIHRYEEGAFFPHLSIASADHIGGKRARGRNINVPWPCAGLNDIDYLHAFHRVVLPIAYEFNPEIVIVSAGFDAAIGDPLGLCRVSPAGYSQMTHLLKGLAGGKLVVCLEGGYNLNAVSSSVAAVTSVLLGDPPPPIDMTLGPSPACIETVQTVIECQSPYWKCLVPTFVRSEPENLHELIVPLHDVLSGYRTYMLSQTFHLRRIDVEDRDLADRFIGQIHVSKNVESHRGFLFIFVHSSWDEVRGRLDAHSNTLRIGKTSVHDASTRYIRDICRNGHALIDIDINATSNEYDTAQVTKEVTKYAWDNIGRHTNASRILLIGVEMGARGLANLISVRPELRSRTECVVMMVSEKLPAVYESIQDWYFNVSRVYTWSDLPRGTSISTVAKYGSSYSAGHKPPNATISTLMNHLELRVFRFLARRMGEAYLAQLAKKSQAVAIPVGRSPRMNRIHVEVEPKLRNGRLTSPVSVTGSSEHHDDRFPDMLEWPESANLDATAVPGTLPDHTQDRWNLLHPPEEPLSPTARSSQATMLFRPSPGADEVLSDDVHQEREMSVDIINGLSDFREPPPASPVVEEVSRERRARRPKRRIQSLPQAEESADDLQDPTPSLVIVEAPLPIERRVRQPKRRIQSLPNAEESEDDLRDPQPSLAIVEEPSSKRSVQRPKRPIHASPEVEESEDELIRPEPPIPRKRQARKITRGVGMSNAVMERFLNISR
ncbi:hypothetical protein, variant 1 [Spizellomyces punctatus DAOM BR117]|uniref:histone deacetylase n=1 Tax=Spizellomyces punctatus (strain DAOM BR117) TaxID=645134 RepID=A0A0L0HIJ8_SPIPD|nr:hypothetical protein, variant 1 [Spizellomyces punctatus DAOM BR117]KND01266.1 hypothetical protein, variant 1 [Spizellomyces punctatus DAOM BR117]|eukprot:XP_016609305.1 hypothetical protein, variant 1 [Spizellomyces punctatus DAOM BR117]